MNLFGGQKLEVCFYARYLYLNKLIGYVDLLDFYENFPECLSECTKLSEALTKFELFLL